MSDTPPPLKTNEATTGVSSMPPVIHELTPTGGIFAAIATAITTVLVLRRRISKDGLEVKKDGAEGNMLATAIAERDKAMATAAEAWKTRTEDAKTIGRLSSDVEHLTESNKRLAEEVSSLRDILYLFLPQSVLTMLQQQDGKIDADKLREAIERQTGQRNATIFNPPQEEL